MKLTIIKALIICIIIIPVISKTGLIRNKSLKDPTQGSINNNFLKTLNSPFDLKQFLQSFRTSNFKFDSMVAIEQFYQEFEAHLSGNKEEIANKIWSTYEFKHDPVEFKEYIIKNLKLALVNRISNANPDKSAFITSNTNFLDKNDMTAFHLLTMQHIPKYLIVPTYGIDLGLYISYGNFIWPIKETLPQVTLEKVVFADHVGVYLDIQQICGSCLNFATQAVLTNFYIRYYKNKNPETFSEAEQQGMVILNEKINTRKFAIDPFQIMACTNGKIEVDSEYKNEFKQLFPKSNGNYHGHGCGGGFSPETLYYAKHNRGKLRNFYDFHQKTVETISSDYRTYLLGYELYLDKFCYPYLNKPSLPLPFPDFNIVHIDKHKFFANSKAEEIAKTLASLVKKYGFLLASIYYNGKIEVDTFDLSVKCNLHFSDLNSLRTWHYVAIVGVEKLPSRYIAKVYDSISARIVNIEIKGDYVDCNLLNNIFAIEKILS